MDAGEKIKYKSTLTKTIDKEMDWLTFNRHDQIIKDKVYQVIENFLVQYLNKSVLYTNPATRKQLTDLLSEQRTTEKRLTLSKQEAAYLRNSIEYKILRQKNNLRESIDRCETLPDLDAVLYANERFIEHTFVADPEAKANFERLPFELRRMFAELHRDYEALTEPSDPIEPREPHQDAKIIPLEEFRHTKK